jgi:hypothetical protein
LNGQPIRHEAPRRQDDTDTRPGMEFYHGSLRDGMETKAALEESNTNLKTITAPSPHCFTARCMTLPNKAAEMSPEVPAILHSPRREMSGQADKYQQLVVDEGTWGTNSFHNLEKQ